MDSVLIWIFLFIALVVGWLLGYSSKVSKRKVEVSSPDKKHRLQLLFDSYSDDAIDRLINSLEVSRETLQMHLSIGKHFRKQGEVEKAILIHQNLMAHPEISNDSSEAIIFELAKDYKAAGLFDRAESLLSQLLQSKQYAYQSQRLLLDICETEKDWQGALDIAQSIDLKRHPELSIRVSQYFCELAGVKLEAKQVLEASKLYKLALSVNRQCVRAILGQASIAKQEENYSDAIRYLKQVAEISPADIPLALAELHYCTLQTQSFDQHQSYLKGLYKETGQIAVMLSIVSSMEAQGLTKEAFNFLLEQLSNLPSLEALDYLFSMQEMSGEIHQELAQQLIKIIARENSKRAKFLCIQCGFSSGHLHWNCPSCKNWQTVKPVLEYEKKVSSQ